MLHLRIEPLVVQHKAPLPGDLFWHNEAWGRPNQVAGLKPTSVDEVPKDLLHGLPSLSPEGVPQCLYTQLTLWAGGGKTGLPLKKVSPYFSFKRALSVCIFHHSSDMTFGFTSVGELGGLGPSSFCRVLRMLSLGFGGSLAT